MLKSEASIFPCFWKDGNWSLVLEAFDKKEEEKTSALPAGIVRERLERSEIERL